MTRASYRLLRRLFRISIVMLLAAFPIAVLAHAAGGVGCISKSGDAEINISMGRLPIFAPSFVSARLGEKTWASNPQFGEIELGDSQGMIEADRFSADFADVNVTKVIISLRIDLSADDDVDGTVGILTFEDGIPRKVACQFE